jgi:hypothetical protein
MAEKHKSKYTSPKDLEKSQKPKTRKDLKDYTHDDKDGAMNPYSTKEKQTRVSRKTDKAVISDVENMVPKLTDKDRVYKKLEDADYDPKHAAKYFTDNQKTDTKEYKDKLKNIDHGVTTIELQEKLNRLTLENQERLVREYIRRKIAIMLAEQPSPEPVEPEPVEPEAEAPVEEPETEPEADTDVPTSPEDTEDPTDTGSELVITPEDRFVKYLKQKETGIDKATAVITSLARSIKDADADQKSAVYKMLQSYAIAARNAIGDTK